MSGIAGQVAEWLGWLKTSGRLVGVSSACFDRMHIIDQKENKQVENPHKVLVGKRGGGAAVVNKTHFKGLLNQISPNTTKNKQIKSMQVNKLSKGLPSKSRGS
jgi:hypothetical protein